MKKLVALFSCLALVLFLLAGCGSAATSGTGASASADGNKTAPSSAKLKVALCLSGAVNDQGWNQSAYEGAKKACQKYGYTLSYTENLGTADIKAAFNDYASSGYNVIIGHGFEFGDPALEVAKNYPNVKFICTESNAKADNVASYVMACEQTAYVEGIIAAGMTKSNKIGAIGPIQGDSLVKIINGYEDGAKSVNPNIKVETSWTNSYTDTQLAQEAANSMIQDGVDVLKHCANACGNGAITAAVKANIWCQGDSYDQSPLAPKNILDSALYNVDVVIDTALKTVVNGTFKGDVYNLGMKDGAVEVLLSNNLPDNVKSTAQKAIDNIKSGTLVVQRDYTVRK
ncbi:BMP family protein [Desulfosporosinus sp. PR]|uniref:BMP family protein n=1 Tax=Candidatus Desulfosporosinus nitrosoreducens TaxID=3401928 RepID=UPI0027F47364|nr:BMP family protein [Desulfosporosinus sp. PR]MDQ7092186.1 BMP family protein [Desulfosporosinus sp. PR]